MNKPKKACRCGELPHDTRRFFSLHAGPHIRTCQCEHSLFIHVWTFCTGPQCGPARASVNAPLYGHLGGNPVIAAVNIFYTHLFWCFTSTPLSLSHAACPRCHFLCAKLAGASGSFQVWQEKNKWGSAARNVRLGGKCSISVWQTKVTGGNRFYFLLK